MDIQEIIKQKFTSSNSIPVDSIRITRKEYGQLITSVKEECAKKVENLNDGGKISQIFFSKTSSPQDMIDFFAKAIRDSK